MIENSKMSMKGITKDGKIFLVHGLREKLLVKCPCYLESICQNPNH